MSGEPKLIWESFAAAIARAGGVPAEVVTQRSRLVADLGLDSLALSEVVVFLLVELEVATLDTDLATRDWDRVTVGELFEEYQRGERAPRSSEYVIRKRQPR